MDRRMGDFLGPCSTNFRLSSSDPTHFRPSTYQLVALLLPTFCMSSLTLPGALLHNDTLGASLLVTKSSFRTLSGSGNPRSGAPAVDALRLSQRALTSQHAQSQRHLSTQQREHRPGL